MSISPKLSMYINLMVAVLAALVSGTISLAGLVPDPVTHEIVQWSTFILSVYGVISAAMHSVSASSDGPLTNIRIKIEKIPPKGSGTVAAIFACLICIGLLSFGEGPVNAKPIVKHNKIVHIYKHAPVQKQPESVNKKDLPPLGIIQDGPFEPYNFVSAIELTPVIALTAQPVANAAATAGPTDLAWNASTAQIMALAVQPAKLETGLNADAPKVGGVISDVWTKLQKVTLEDLQYANNLAVNNGDTVASTCYSGLITLIQKSQTANINPTNGQPMPLPNVHIVTDLENLLIIYRELQPTSATSVACAPLMNAIKVGSISALLSGLGTAGALGSGLVLP